MKIKSAIYIEFNILTTFMESIIISHLFPLNKVGGQSVKWSKFLSVFSERHAKALFQVIKSLWSPY